MISPVISATCVECWSSCRWACVVNLLFLPSVGRDRQWKWRNRVKLNQNNLLQEEGSGFASWEYPFHKWKKKTRMAWFFLSDPLCFVWLWLFIISPVDILKLVDFTSALTQTVDINKWNKSKKCKILNTKCGLIISPKKYMITQPNQELRFISFRLQVVQDWWMMIQVSADVRLYNCIY